MYIEVRGHRHKVHINAPNPFALSHGRVIGITPDAPESMLPEFEAAWKSEFNREREDREWFYPGSNGREYQILMINGKLVCDCWPYRKAGGCRHIEAVKEDCLLGKVEV